MHLWLVTRKECLHQCVQRCGRHTGVGWGGSDAVTACGDCGSIPRIRRLCSLYQAQARSWPGSLGPRPPLISTWSPAGRTSCSQNRSRCLDFSSWPHRDLDPSGPLPDAAQVPCWPPVLSCPVPPQSCCPWRTWWIYKHSPDRALPCSSAPHGPPLPFCLLLRTQAGVSSRASPFPRSLGDALSLWLAALPSQRLLASV